MNDRLELNDAALEACATSCAAASEALSIPSREMTVPRSVTGVTDVGTKVSEFVELLAVACSVLGSAAEGVRLGAMSSKHGSDSVDDALAGALAVVAGGRR